jgi:hypothetical protein
MVSLFTGFIYVTTVLQAWQPPQHPPHTAASPCSQGGSRVLDDEPGDNNDKSQGRTTGDDGDEGGRGDEGTTNGDRNQDHDRTTTTKRPSTHPHRCEPLLAGWTVGATDHEEEDDNPRTTREGKRGMATRRGRDDERDDHDDDGDGDDNNRDDEDRDNQTTGTAREP